MREVLNGNMLSLIKLDKSMITEFPKEEALKPKSLVGRYLKALVDRPQYTDFKKGEYTKIINCLTENTFKIDRKHYEAYLSSKDWELMPEGFIPPIVEPPKFIEGSWYKCSEWPITIAAKCTKTSNTEFSYDQYISSELKYNKSTRTSHLDKYIKIPLSEIQQYLPEDHPDKIKVDVIPEYVECIKEDSGIVIGNIYEAQFVSKQENTMTKFKHGDKVRILNRHPNNKTGDTKWMYDAKGCIGYICNYNDDKYVIHSNSNSSGEYYGMLDRNNKDLGYFLDSDLELVDEKRIPKVGDWITVIKDDLYPETIGKTFQIMRVIEDDLISIDSEEVRNRRLWFNNEIRGSETRQATKEEIENFPLFKEKVSEAKEELFSLTKEKFLPLSDIPLMSSPINEDKQTKSIVLWTPPKGTEEVKTFVPLTIKQIKKQVLWQS